MLKFCMLLLAVNLGVLFVWFFLLLFVFFFPVLAVRCVLCVVEAFVFPFFLVCIVDFFVVFVICLVILFGFVFLQVVVL
jgi:hypothetical protein